MDRSYQPAKSLFEWLARAHPVGESPPGLRATLLYPERNNWLFSTHNDSFPRVISAVFGKLSHLWTVAGHTCYDRQYSFPKR